MISNDMLPFKSWGIFDCPLPIAHRHELAQADRANPADQRIATQLLHGKKAYITAKPTWTAEKINSKTQTSYGDGLTLLTPNRLCCSQAKQRLVQEARK